MAVNLFDPKLWLIFAAALVVFIFVMISSKVIMGRK